MGRDSVCAHPVISDVGKMSGNFIRIGDVKSSSFEQCYLFIYNHGYFAIFLHLPSFFAKKLKNHDFYVCLYCKAI